MADPAEGLRQRLRAVGRLDDREIDPTEAVLLLAALTRPDGRAGVDIAPYTDLLAEMAGQLRGAAERCADAEALAVCLYDLLSRRHRFRCDEREDDDPSHMDLISVMDSRRGSADAIGLVALDISQRAGFDAEALAFPTHFLLRIGHPDGQRAILDPLGGGRPLGPPDLRALLKAMAGLDAELEPAHYAAMGNRDLVLRLCNGTKLRLLRLGYVERALVLVEALLLVAPESCPLWREAGLMHMRLDHHAPAVAALEQFVSRTPNAQAKARTQALLAELRRRMH